MKLAVTYENGLIFQHFGHCEQFKIFNVEDNAIVSSEVVSAIGSGHGALAGFLTMNSVDILICGGIGGGAQAALAEKGMSFHFTEEAAAFVAKASYSAKFGARNMRRYIQTHVEDALAEKIIASYNMRVTSARVDFDGEKLVIDCM